jgi:biopolymer transport protein ExbD
LQYICQIDVSPLLFIFLVLFISLVKYISSGRAGVSVDLPKSEQFSRLPAARREDAMRVATFGDGRVYFGLHRILIRELPGQVCASLCGDSENRVYLSADGRVRYSDVEKTLHDLRLAGVEHVSFFTESAQR